MVSLVAALTIFATIDEAAVSALKHAATICDPRYECGGVVRAVPGGYEASGLITSNRPFGVDLGEFYARDVVADFHTHICSVHNRPFAAFFSSADAFANQGLHTVGYMLSMCDGYIRRYDPSQDDRDDEEVDFHSGRVIYLTIGHIVSWVPGDATRVWRLAIGRGEAQPSRERGGARASTHTDSSWSRYRTRTRRDPRS
ncbi:MAG TPA: hypothetical protein VMT66_12925 [Steroidobacteraceae bacterium]|nr:hypothetical protein [Steroidobacteraceae bacterium]